MEETLGETIRRPFSRLPFLRLPVDLQLRVLLCCGNRKFWGQPELRSGDLGTGYSHWSDLARMSISCTAMARAFPTPVPCRAALCRASDCYGVSLCGADLIQKLAAVEEWHGQLTTYADRGQYGFLSVGTFLHQMVSSTRNIIRMSSICITSRHLGSRSNVCRNVHKETFIPGGFRSR